MKTFNRYLAMALCGGGFVLSAQAEKVRLEDLSTEVRDKIRAQTGAAQIEDIDRTTQNGQTQYEVALKRNGQHTELKFDQNGQLLNAPGTALDSRKVTFAELPPTVQRVVEARLKGTQPNDIDRRVENGQISYEVGFKQGDKQHELLVSQDGRILRDAGVTEGSLVAASTAVGSAAASASDAISTSAQAIPLSDKKKVIYDDLPNPVKVAVGVHAKGARIEDVERGQWRARNIYEIAFKDQGRHVELQVEEKGRVLHDPRLSRNQAAGVPAASATGAAASAYPDVKSAVSLSGSEKVDRRSVPAAVEQSITRSAPGAQIEDIERGSWRGMNVYEVGFKDQGKHVELQIDEQGRVVFDPRKK